MRFSMPRLPCEFEIPDQWLNEVGISNFNPTAEAYHSTNEAIIVSLRDIAPPSRFPECPMDGGGFGRIRLIGILKKIVRGEDLPPVCLIDLDDNQWITPPPYRYLLQDGTHRFYASIMAGFKSLPAVVTPAANLKEGGGRPVS